MNILRNGRAAGNQPATANAHDNGIQIGHVFQQFQRHGALASHDHRVVVRRDQRAAGFFHHLRRNRLAVVYQPVVSDYSCAGIPRGLHLGFRGIFRHHDYRLCANMLRGNGSRLRMVAGRECDDALLQLLRRQREDHVGRAPDLKRAAALQILAFEKYIHARARIDAARGHHGRPAGQRTDAIRCFANHVGSNHFLFRLPD